MTHLIAFFLTGISTLLAAEILSDTLAGWFSWHFLAGVLTVTIAGPFRDDPKYPEM
jgi:hypothetical protein